MWDEDRDKQMMRNQMLAIILMMVLLWGWYSFFVPEPTPPVQPVEVAEPGAFPSEPDVANLLRRARPSDVDTGLGEWPSLPQIPVQDDPMADEVSISDGPLVLVFTRIGARLKQATVYVGDGDDGSIQLVQDAGDLPDTEAIYPLGLRFSDKRLGDELDYRRFDAAVDPSGKSVTFTLEIPGALAVRKTFRLGESAHVVNVDVEYENLESGPRQIGIDLEPAYIVNWGPGLVVVGEGRTFPPEMVWHNEDGAHIFKPKDLPETDGVPDDKRIPGVDWIGYKSKYFFAALKPGGENAVVDGWALGVEDAFRFGLYTPRFELEAGETNDASFKLYVGPMHIGELSEAWPTLSSGLRFFKPKGFLGQSVNSAMDSFAKLLLRNLNWWYGFIPNYGIAIILLTVVVRSVMFPLTLKSMRSMKKMQTLSPEMTALREKHKDDQQALSQATMQLYKERGINPVAGCFPMLLQMPVFIALYRMLWNAFELRGAGFSWIDDLSQPDRLFHMPFMQSIPVVGQQLEYFNILPILVGVSMILSMKLTPQSGPMQNPQQKFMMTFMPIMFGVISYAFSAGLNLYVLTSTVLGIAQNKLVRVTDTSTTEVSVVDSGGADGGPKKPKRKPKAKPQRTMAEMRKKKSQHFYDRAQQRKREIAKADRKKNRRK